MWFPIQQIDKAHLAASANLARARSEAQEFGEERRLGIKRRVLEMRGAGTRDKEPARSVRTDGGPRRDPDPPD